MEFLFLGLLVVGNECLECLCYQLIVMEGRDLCECLIQRHVPLVLLHPSSEVLFEVFHAPILFVSFAYYFFKNSC